MNKTIGRSWKYSWSYKNHGFILRNWAQRPILSGIRKNHQIFQDQSRSDTWNLYGN